MCHVDANTTEQDYNMKRKMFHSTPELPVKDGRRLAYCIRHSFDKPSYSDDIVEHVVCENNNRFFFTIEELIKFLFSMKYKCDNYDTWDDDPFYLTHPTVYWRTGGNEDPSCTLCYNDFIRLDPWWLI